MRKAYYSFFLNKVFKFILCIQFVCLAKAQTKTNQSATSTKNATNKTNVVKQQNNNTKTELSIFKTIEDFNNVQLIKILQTNPNIINKPNHLGYTPLHWLILNFNSKAINTDTGNQQIKKGIDCFRTLLNYKADTGVLTKTQYNALQFAVVRAKPELVDILLNEYKMYPKVVDSFKNNLYHLIAYAIENAEKDKIKQLIDVMGKFIIGNWDKNNLAQTPLIFILSKPRCKTSDCQTEALYAVKYLCDEVSVNFFDAFNKKPYDYAKEHNTWALPIIEYYIKKRKEEEEREAKKKQTSESNADLTINESFDVIFTGACDWDYENRGYLKMINSNELKVEFRKTFIRLKFRNDVFVCYVTKSRKDKNGVYEYYGDKNQGSLLFVAYHPKFKVLEVKFANTFVYGTKSYYYCVEK